MSIRISEAERQDLDDMLALFPRLASFEVPARRNKRHLWEGDANILKAWARGEAPQSIVHVARADDGRLLGMTMVTLREELLSHNASAHLEAIVVDDDAQGKGVGTALLKAAEDAARARGALSMTLHVFSTNQRARRMYQGAGYDEELLRCIKTFSADALK